jgi:predicted TIM-barrel fold metal-dependent hydrolase
MDSVKERFSKQFYFDTAGWAFPEQIKGLLEYTTVDRILYGSDFPFTNLKIATTLSEDHDKYLPEVFPKEQDQEALCYKNATRLLEEHGN